MQLFGFKVLPLKDLVDAMDLPDYVADFLLGNWKRILVTGFVLYITVRQLRARYRVRHTRFTLQDVSQSFVVAVELEQAKDSEETREI